MVPGSEGCAVTFFLGLVAGAVIGYAIRSWSEAYVVLRRCAFQNGFKSVRQYKKWMKGK